MAWKLQCFVVYSSVMFYMSFGCTFYRDDCIYVVECLNSVVKGINTQELRDTDGDCSNVIYIYDEWGNGPYPFIPIQLQFGYNTQLTGDGNSEVNIEIPSRTIADLLVSVDMNTINLSITPNFPQMERLKLLNLSFNYLIEANLFNNAELKHLENLDLSHNIINTINVESNQFVYESLRTLNLSHNLITTITGGIFESFKLMESLDLSYNNLFIIDQYSFEGLRNLKYLYLSKNNISDINMSLFRFSSLIELCLDNNEIENLLPQDFEILSNLQKLDCNFNKIKSINEGTFNNMLALTTVTFHHNLLSYITKNAFLSMDNLKTVDFSSNMLKKLPKDLLRNKNITSFSIAQNSLEGALSRGMFEGLHLITKLDISFQAITGIEEYAFFGLENLAELLLSSNKISTVSKYSFKTLKSLKTLDLSQNFIVTLDLDKSDLLSLETLILSNNFINQIFHEDFKGLTRLRFLDIANNNISKLEPASFKYLEFLESFQISRNPLRGDLLNNSFQGLILIPVLDLSQTFLTSVRNGSFNGMVHLQELNISRNSINIVEFNAFVNTGSLTILDLSFNKLTSFFVNWNDLQNLTTIQLNNNFLIHIPENVFKNMLQLKTVILSHNSIQNIESGTLLDQTDLRFLDLSYNYNLTFEISTIKNAKFLEKLLLSAIKNVVDFANFDSISLNELEISFSRNIYNASNLHLNSLKYLKKLKLNNNKLEKLEFSAFKNMSGIRWLDLSINNISFIEPGTFRDNIFLHSLNLSHNSLASLSYGIFRGLINLNTLDVSFNSIHDLNRARFYDTVHLNTLIADGNKITDVREEFNDFHLELLSIGDNPISCEKISLLKYKSRITIGAIKKEENKHNVDGITCENQVFEEPEKKSIVHNKNENNVMLVSIRDILLNISRTNKGFQLPIDSVNKDLLVNINEKLDKEEINNIEQQKEFKNITYHMADEIDRTNSFLERILKAIVGMGSLQDYRKIVENKISNFSRYNNETDTEINSKQTSLTFEVKQMRQELLYLENIVSEVDKKLTKSRIMNSPLVLETSNRTNVFSDSHSEHSFVFVEVCVSLILLILVCFLLYKFYKSKLFVSSSRSLSTRHITESIDNSNL